MPLTSPRLLRKAVRRAVPALVGLLALSLGLANTPAHTAVPTKVVQPDLIDLGGEAALHDLQPAPEGAVEARQNHLASLGVDRWHAAGFRGQGVKIAVLDTGFRGYKEHL